MTQSLSEENEDGDSDIERKMKEEEVAELYGDIFLQKNKLDPYEQEYIKEEN